MKWIMITLLFFSLVGEARQKPHHKRSKMDIGLFTIQFYRLKLNSSITVQDITTDRHFYVVDGKTTDREAVFYLSRNLLKSRMLARFNIKDTLLRFNGNKFKMYLKTDNKKPEENEPWVKITHFSREDFEKHMLFSGQCQPNNRRIAITGDVKGFADCKEGQWKFKVPRLPSNRVYVYTQASNTKGQIYLDGISLIKTKKKPEIIEP